MPDLSIRFWGAAGQVTGSMHLLQMGAAQILLDSGLFQGRREAVRHLNENLPLDPRSLSTIVLSHAHIDHSGRLPLLTKHGYRGPIWSTPATRDLAAIMLADGAEIQRRDLEHLKRHGRLGAHVEPLYDMEDAVAVTRQISTLPYGQEHTVFPGARVAFRDAGHILGSASVDLRLEWGGRKHRLVFSGDIGRYGLPVIRDPDPPRGEIDTLVIESTYAHRTHESTQGAEAKLAELVSRVAARRGKVLIPSFAVGRAQELIYALHALYRQGAIPSVPIYVDSPLAIEATSVFRLHPELFDRSERLVSETSDLFDFPLVRYARRVEESRALNDLDGAAVIIAASGMAESGRILHHLLHHSSDRRNLILFVGFQAEHTLGRRIQEGRKQVSVLGEEVTIAAEVETLGGYSAHGDREELRRWVRSLGGPVHRAFVVHGEREGLSAMAELLRSEGVGEAIVPQHGEQFSL